MSHVSGPDSIVAMSGTTTVVPTTHCGGVPTTSILPILTSLAEHGGLPPIFSLMQAFPLDCASATPVNPAQNPTKRMTATSRLNIMLPSPSHHRGDLNSTSAPKRLFAG